MEDGEDKARFLIKIMYKQNNKLDNEIVEKYCWIETLSCWLLVFCLFGGFYLLFKDNQSYYGWLLFKVSFIFLLIMVFYKVVIYLIILIDLKIKVKRGILELKDPIKDAVSDALANKSKPL